ncbi:MAG: putative protein-disulfide isomerase [Thiomicrorhabdus sp.]|nr:MAG: putative protein-disulfide isomerase [Thiomicrorhabdus sp.]
MKSKSKIQLMSDHTNAPLSRATLYYIHDPMCSWCWAFRPVWLQLKEALFEEINIINTLGGLAPDSDQPMPADLQKTLQAIWGSIQHKVPNTQFNFNFWSTCQPRRSTYPACRAVIAAMQQGKQFEEPMILAIQQAYYLQAQNPSDESTLATLAKNIGLNVSQFIQQLNADETQRQLDDQIIFNHSIDAKSFPSLVLIADDKPYPIKIDYLHVNNMLKQINEILQKA